MTRLELAACKTLASQTREDRTLAGRLGSPSRAWMGPRASFYPGREASGALSLSSGLRVKRSAFQAYCISGKNQPPRSAPITACSDAATLSCFHTCKGKQRAKNCTAALFVEGNSMTLAPRHRIARRRSLTTRAASCTKRAPLAHQKPKTRDARTVTRLALSRRDL